MLKVLNAQISQRQKTVNGGCTIEFDSVDNFVLDTIVSLKNGEKIHDFSVNSISINPDNSLRLTANEIGYWGSKFDNSKDFDLRTIIGLPIEVVTDVEVIKKIRQSSQYC
jgi:hypothetical protein